LVLPALNQKIKGKEYFVGDQQTMLDLIIFVELETVFVLMQENGRET
jgi:glutathione S-transferase